MSKTWPKRSSTEPFRLSRRALLNIKNRLGEWPCCDRCGEPFQVGDLVLSRVSGKHGTGKRKRYHVECWESLFLSC